MKSVYLKVKLGEFKHILKISRAKALIENYFMTSLILH